MNEQEPAVEIFYDDAATPDGTKVPVKWSGLTSTLGPVRATKIPREEMALEDADATFHVKLPESDDA
jgi:hypothetical protein